jgi:hypothetical protein
MRVLAASLFLLLLPGCAHWFGPAHGAFYAVGSTPDTDSCKLHLTVVGSKSPPKEWEVWGNFRQRLLVSHSRKGHRLSLICNEAIFAERFFKYGRDVSIGGELAVNGSAP